jgi:hypothetical protein
MGHPRLPPQQASLQLVCWGKQVVQASQYLQGEVALAAHRLKTVPEGRQTHLNGVVGA